MSSGRDEFAWLAEFAADERDAVDGRNALAADERAKIERLDAELFGLLAEGLDPVEPSAAAKSELMRRLAAPKVAQFRPRQEEVSTGTTPRWLLPLAAGIAALAIGATGMMYGTVRSQGEELARLELEVEQLGSEAIGVGSTTAVASNSLADLRVEYAAARQNLALVGSRGVEICPLRPLEGAADDGEPYGTLFLAADHQHWYVRVDGFEVRADRYYQVWFETADELVAAGNLVGNELELSASTMPEGTLAVHVSVETDPEPAVPSSEILLYGNDMVRVL